MRRSFSYILTAILTFVAYTTPAYAVVIKDADPTAGVPRTGMLIVAPSVFINPQAAADMGSLIVTNDADAKRKADEASKQPGIHYVEMLSGTEATMSGVTTTLERLAKQEQLQGIVFDYRGFGLNADAPPSCFVLADWDPASPDATCFPVTTVADLLAKVAPHQLLSLDATRTTPKVMHDIGYEAWGPSADDFPLGMPAVSVGKSREAVDCSVFSPLITQVIAQIKPNEGLTMGMLTERLTALAPEASRVRCGGATLHITFGGTYALTDVVVPPVVIVSAPPVAAQQSLPTKPPTLAKKPTKLKAPTIASAAVTAVCGIGSVVAWQTGEARLAQYNNRAWAEENYPNNDAARIAAGEAELPTYGYLALGGATCAGIGAATTGLTWYFGK